MVKKIFFQLGFSSEIKVLQLGSARLGSARNLHSSARLEPENSSSGSSLIPMYVYNTTEEFSYSKIGYDIQSLSTGYQAKIK